MKIVVTTRIAALGKSALPLILLLALVVNFGSGVWPVVPVEGDELGVLRGLAAWAQGVPGYQGLAYLFPLQPGSYALLHGLEVLTGVDRLLLFGMVTVGGGLLFGVSVVLLLRDVTCLPWTAAAALVLLSQEMSAAVYYPNTNAIAAGALGLSLVCAWRARTMTSFLLGGILLGVAGWLRADTLLLAPAAALFPWCRGLAGRELSRALTALVAGSAVTVAGLFAASGTFPSEAWTLYRERDNALSVALFARLLPVTYSYVLVGIAVLGVGVLIRQRAWRLVFLILAGLVPTFAVYGASFTTTKYGYFATPFILLPACHALRALWAAKGYACNSAIASLAAAALLELFVGVRSAASAVRRFEPSPMGICADLSLSNRRIEVGLGSGELLPTADGLRLRGGLWYAPAEWRRHKKTAQREISRLQQLELVRPGSTAVCSTYLGFQVLAYEAARQSPARTERRPFPENPSSLSMEWTLGAGPVFTAILVNHTERDAAEVRESTHRFSPDYFVNDRGGNAARHLGIVEPEWSLLTPDENALIAIYRRNRQTPSGPL